MEPAFTAGAENKELVSAVLLKENQDLKGSPVNQCADYSGHDPPEQWTESNKAE